MPYRLTFIYIIYKNGTIWFKEYTNKSFGSNLSLSTIIFDDSSSIQLASDELAINLFKINPYLRNWQILDKILLNFKANDTWLTHAVSKVAKKFSEKEFKKTLKKLSEKIDLGINNNGNYSEHLIKTLMFSELLRFLTRLHSHMRNSRKRMYLRKMIINFWLFARRSKFR